MPSSIVKYFSCIYCGAEFTAEKPDDIHTKANKNRINRDDIETLHKCNECGQNNKIYWSEQKKT
jgi:DNA-directed RNA polymerase subunit RPC12/RpoP